MSRSTKTAKSGKSTERASRSAQNGQVIVKRNSVNGAFISIKTIECQVMDIADDIAYSTFDLEDGLKAGFFNPI